jgi:hypothetical protein
MHIHIHTHGYRQHRLCLARVSTAMAMGVSTRNLLGGNVDVLLRYKDTDMHIHARTHARMKQTHMHIHTHWHKHTYTHKHRHTCAHRHACRHTSIGTDAHTDTHANTQASARMRTQTRMHTQPTWMMDGYRELKSSRITILSYSPFLGSSTRPPAIKSKKHFLPLRQNSKSYSY